MLVLEDLDSGARGWSEAPRAIRNALVNVGLDASIGVFYGIPDRFELENGVWLDLSTLLRTWAPRPGSIASWLTWGSGEFSPGSMRPGRGAAGSPLLRPLHHLPRPA